jgi:hypothetical protein
MLVPQDGAEFRKEHQFLYPGGPPRAVRFEELVNRYVKPFVGSLVETSQGLPAGHKFTSGVARLSGIAGTAVYVGYNRYAPTGRGGRLVSCESEARKVSPGAIHTKLYPAGEQSFRFKACFTTAPFADDEIFVPADRQPAWFSRLNSLIIDGGSLSSGAAS